MARTSKSKSNRHTSKESTSKKLSGKVSKRKFRVHLKPIEIVIIAWVILMGASGFIIYQKHEQKVHQQLNIAPASNQSSPTPDSSTSTQPAQSATPSTTTPSVTTKTKPSTSSSTDDPQTDALENQINFTLQCDSDASAAQNDYSAVVTSAENTYNTDIANGDQQAESDYPAGSETLTEVEYNIMNGEITKYNATIAPAYATYQSAMNTINSRGCNLTPSSEYLYGTNN